MKKFSSVIDFDYFIIQENYLKRINFLSGYLKQIIQTLNCLNDKKSKKVIIDYSNLLLKYAIHISDSKYAKPKSIIITKQDVKKIKGRVLGEVAQILLCIEFELNCCANIFKEHKKWLNN